MSHLAEVHITDDLKHYPDQVLALALVIHSHLENAAGMLSMVKGRLENAVSTSETEDIPDDAEYLEIFEKIDALITQCRGSKVVVTKGARQVEDLKSRSLTLDPSTIDTVDQTHESTKDLNSAIRIFSNSVLKTLSDELQEHDLASSRLSSSLSNSPVTLSALANKTQSMTAQLHTFLNLTNSLSQTVEFVSPPPSPPWKLLAQKLRDEVADVAARETELVRLKDEISEKGTTLAIKDRILEELSVKNEVLEKRVGESTGRRERLKELESMNEAFKDKEKEYIAKLSRLRKELEAIENERETWKQSSQSAPANSRTSQGAPVTTPTSAAALLQIEAYKAEIAALQSTVRYHRTIHHQSFVAASNNFLSTPISPQASSRPRLAPEAKDVLKEMVHLISESSSQPIKLQRRAQEDRLRWRPVKETSAWHVQRQRDDFEEWREWRDAVAERAGRQRREGQRLQESRTNKIAIVDGRKPAKILADAPVRIAGDGEERWQTSQSSP